MSSLRAEVVLDWADGKYLFALKGAQIEELQRKCGKGVAAIAQDVFNDRYSYADLKETIRLGLVGGGTDPVEAVRLVEAYVEGMALAPPKTHKGTLDVARAVLSALFFGMEEYVDEDEEPEDPLTKAVKGVIS